MACIVVLCQRPHHLSCEEADAWFREAAASLTGSPHVRAVRVGWLQSASPRHHRPWDLMLSLALADGAEASACIADTGCAELLADLRLLGMSPSVLVVPELEAL